jgi:hypothetical protein
MPGDVAKHIRVISYDLAVSSPQLLISGSHHIHYSTKA